jgi:hypothetical protein
VRKPIGWVVVLAFGLTGCSASSDGVDFAQLEHVHSVATDGEEFFLASHHGLYAWSGGSWHLRGEEFDVMGLAFDNGVFYASGHPGPTQDYPTPWGSWFRVTEARPGLLILSPEKWTFTFSKSEETGW